MANPAARIFLKYPAFMGGSGTGTIKYAGNVDPSPQPAVLCQRIGLRQDGETPEAGDGEHGQRVIWSHGAVASPKHKYTEQVLLQC